MKPLQVYLHAEEFERLAAWSRQRGWTKSQAIRAAVRVLTRPESTGTDPLLALSGAIDGLPADFAARFQHYLGDTFVAEAAAPYRPRRRRAKTSVRR